MPVSSTANSYTYSGNDVTTEFAFSNKFFADTDLTVYLITDATGVSVTQTLTTHYTVTGAGVDAGGTVTMITAPATGETLYIVRDLPYTQATDYIEGDGFPADAHEDAIDKLTILCQQNNYLVNRRLGYAADYSGSASVEIPNPVALNYLRWNAAGDALENTTSVSSITAADVPCTASGDVSATNVDAAIAELASEKIATSAIGVTVQAYDADTPTAIVSQAIAEAGTDTTAYSWTAERVKQAVAAHASQLVFRTDSTTEALTQSTLDTVTNAAVTSAITKTLPAVSTLLAGTQAGFHLVSTTGDRMTIACNAADTIRIGNGSVTSFDLATAGDFVTLVADTSNTRWVVLVDRIEGPYSRASYTGAGQSLSAATWTKLQYNVENNDTHACYDESTNYRFTPNIPGWYLIKAGIFLSLSAAGRFATALYINGSSYESGQRSQHTAGGGTDGYAINTWMVYMNGSTDYAEIYANSIDGGTTGTFDDPTNLEPIFECKRIG